MNAKLIILILVIAWGVYLVLANADKMGLNLFPGIDINMPVFIFGLIFLAMGYFLSTLLKNK